MLVKNARSFHMDLKRLKDKNKLILFIAGVILLLATVVVTIVNLSSRTYARFVSVDLIARWAVMLIVAALYCASIVYALLPAVSDSPKFGTHKSFLFMVFAELGVVIVAAISLIDEFQTSLNLLEDACYLFIHLVLIVLAFIGKTFTGDPKKTSAAGFVGAGVCLVLVIADLAFFATKKQAYRTVDFWFVASALITLLPYLAIAVNGLTSGKENEEKAR